MQSKARYAVLALFVLACVRTAGAALLGIGTVNYLGDPYVTVQGVHGTLGVQSVNNTNNSLTATNAYHYNTTTSQGTFEVAANIQQGTPSNTQGTVSWGKGGVETFFTSLGRQVGYYHITLVVGENGNIISGSLEIRGDVNGVANDGASAGRNDEILFKSTTPTAFGWTENASIDKFEMQFSQFVDANDSFAPDPGTINVLLDLGNITGFTGVKTGAGTKSNPFKGPFNIGDFAVSGQHSTAFYPEPSVMGLLGVGMLLLRRCRR